MPTNLSSENQESFPDNLEFLASGDYTEINKVFRKLPLSILRKTAINHAREGIKQSLTPDKNLVQVLESLDEAHTVYNLASERFTTWYSQISGMPRDSIDHIIDNLEIPAQMKPLRQHIKATEILIDKLSSYLDEKSPIVFPNLVEILGSQLSARIVSIAGNLGKLARMPASTIQLLGAEKALFRHMSDGSPPPKHGVLYQHPSVKRAPRRDKGRASRKLAGKVAIASKLDFYGGNDG